MELFASDQQLPAWVQIAGGVVVVVLTPIFSILAQVWILQSAERRRNMKADAEARATVTEAEEEAADKEDARYKRLANEFKKLWQEAMEQIAYLQLENTTCKVETATLKADLANVHRILKAHRIDLSTGLSDPPGKAGGHQ